MIELFAFDVKTEQEFEMVAQYMRLLGYTAHNKVCVDDLAGRVQRGIKTYVAAYDDGEYAWAGFLNDGTILYPLNGRSSMFTKEEETMILLGWNPFVEVTP